MEKFAWEELWNVGKEFKKKNASAKEAVEKRLETSGKNSRANPWLPKGKDISFFTILCER